MLSVIIPCYNSEQHVARAIDSVLKQTYTDYEILLVDNNSIDNTLSVLNAYQSNFPHIIKVLHQHKQGSPAARNKGLMEAKGDMIQFLDADDELLPEKFSTQIDLMQKNTADIIVGACKRYKTLPDGTLIDMPRMIETENIWKSLLTSKLGITSANLWRAEPLLKINGWDESKTSSQEYDLLFRLLKNNAKVEFCTLAQTIVHVTGNSISSTQKPEKVIAVMNNSVRLRMDIKEYLQSKGMLTKELRQFADQYNYSTLVMRDYKPFVPLFLRKGKIAHYVKEMLKENDFKLSPAFILRLHAGKTLEMFKKKFLKK